MCRIVKVAQPNIKALDLDWGCHQIKRVKKFKFCHENYMIKKERKKKKKKPQGRKAYLNPESPIAQDTNKNYLT